LGLDHPPAPLAAYAYVLVEDPGNPSALVAFDVRDASHPREVSWQALPPVRQPITLVPTAHVLIAPQGATLHIFGLNTPARPNPSGSVTLPAGINSVIARGHYAYASLGPSGLEAVDLADPRSPRLLGAVVDPDYDAGAADLDPQTNMIAVIGTSMGGDGSSGVWLVDVGDPAHPEARGSLRVSDKSSPLAVAFGGGRIYATGEVLPEDDFDGSMTAQAMDVIDPTDPEKPKMTGFFAADAPIDAWASPLGVLIRTTEGWTAFMASDALPPSDLGLSGLGSSFAPRSTLPVNGGLTWQGSRVYVATATTSDLTLECYDLGSDMNAVELGATTIQAAAGTTFNKPGTSVTLYSLLR
jgi:hypothetical protein